MTGGSPVTGWYRLPPSGIPITGGPPVTGCMSCGPLLGGNIGHLRRSGLDAQAEGFIEGVQAPQNW